MAHTRSAADISGGDRRVGGALAAMKVFHHKTRKPKFKTGVPAILIIQLIIYFLFSGNEGIILRL